MTILDSSAAVDVRTAVPSVPRFGFRMEMQHAVYRAPPTPSEPPPAPRRRNTDGCNEPLPVGEVTAPAVVRSTDDPAEAVERIVSRRQLLVEEGDLFISRQSKPVRALTERDLYVLTREGLGSVPGRFTKFEQAVAAGDELATKLHVRLYFRESHDDPPQLLKDCRRR